MEIQNKRQNESPLINGNFSMSPLSTMMNSLKAVVAQTVI